MAVLKRHGMRERGREENRVSVPKQDDDAGKTQMVSWATLSPSLVFVLPYVLFFYHSPGTVTSWFDAKKEYEKEKAVLISYSSAQQTEML